MSGPAQLVVFANAVPGRDDAFNRWYDDIHLAEVYAVPGVLGARRFEVVPRPDAPPGHRYLAIYEIATDNPAAVVAEIERRYNSGEMIATDALADDVVMTLALPRGGAS